MENLKPNVSKDHLTISRSRKISLTSGSEYSSDQIPVDLFLNILSRLSVKCMAKCRCVSKLWSSMIRRPNFRQLFPTRYSAQPRVLFIFQAKGKLLFWSSHQSQNPVKHNSLVTMVRHKHFPTNSSSHTFGYVNGFVCFQDQERNTTICNPKTGEFLALPKVEAEFGGRCYLGYDPINEQFKVLCTTWKAFGTHVDHHVMTLGTGTTPLVWRSISCCEPHLPKHDGICINGVLYYPNGYSSSNKIVCFDVRSEKFEFINIAQGMSLGINTTLLNYKGKLGATYTNATRTVKLWILEDANEDKWLRHILVLPDFWWQFGRVELYSLGMTDFGEVVSLLISHTSYVVYYNIEKKTTMRVEIHGTQAFRNRLCFSFLDYVEDVKLM